MENREVMEEFAVIGLDTQEKKAEAEAILKELGYRSDEDVISAWESGNYSYYDSVMSNETQITLDQLRAKVGKIETVEKPTYPCMMEVWDDDETDIVKHNVVAEVQNNGFKGYVVAWNDDGDFVVYKNARPIQPDPLKEVVENMNSQIDTDKAYNKFDGDYKSWEEMRGVLLTPNEAQLIIEALEKNEK